MYLFLLELIFWFTLNICYTHCSFFSIYWSVGRDQILFWWWKRSHTDCPETAVTSNNSLSQISWLTNSYICYVKLHHTSILSIIKKWLTIRRQLPCSGFLLIVACMEMRLQMSCMRYAYLKYTPAKRYRTAATLIHKKLNYIFYFKYIIPYIIVGLAFM